MRLKSLLLGACLLSLTQLNAQTIHVAPNGRDTWPGSEKKPVATFERAQQLAREFARDQEVTVVFEDGI